MDKELILNAQNRNYELENKFNIHPEMLYRVIVSGFNPRDTITYDGVLKDFGGHTHDDGCFSIDNVVLESGFRYFAFSTEKELFDREEIPALGWGTFRFGSISDEHGFYRIRSSLRSDAVSHSIYNKVKGDSQ